METFWKRQVVVIGKVSRYKQLMAVRQGFEPNQRRFAKSLTVRSLWSNGFVSYHVPAAVESTRVLSSPLESTGVVEK